MTVIDRISLLSLLGGAVDAAVRARLRDAGYADLRVPHGYVVQRLLDGPTTATALARDLGVTQQAVSKLVLELGRGGYVERVADPSDARRRPVALTARGRAAVEVARDARRALDDLVASAIGERDAAELTRLLLASTDALGLAAALRDRRVRLPS